MKHKKKITFIIGSLGRGGAERVISILANDYIEKNWDVDIILLLFNKVDYKINNKVNIIDYTGKIQSRLLRIPYWIKKLHEYNKRENPDAIVSFAARINIISYFSMRKASKKMYFSERNDPLKDGRNKIVEILTKIIYKKVKCIIFQTKRARNYFNEINNCEIISNPIDVDCYAQTKKTKKIVTVGRLTKQKNQKLLILAFSTILKKFPDYILEIYGNGELEEELKQLTKNLKINNNVLFKGNVLNIHEKISDATLFVLSSDYEGLSNALLEALMMGIPCISTNCAGSDEYIINEKNGLLVHTGEQRELENAINRMLSNKSLRKMCGENSKKMSKEYSKDNVLLKWHNLIDND